MEVSHNGNLYFAGKERKLKSRIGYGLKVERLHAPTFLQPEGLVARSMFG